MTVLYSDFTSTCTDVTEPTNVLQIYHQMSGLTTLYKSNNCLNQAEAGQFIWKYGKMRFFVAKKRFFAYKKGRPCLP